MTDKRSCTTVEKIPDFSQPACYRIKIRGKLDQSWTDRLYGMSIEVINHGKDQPVSTLLGCLPDQAALAGLLNTLYERHFIILSLELVNSEDIK